MKSALIIIAGLFFLFILAVLGTIGYERYYTSKFNSTPLGTTMANLREDWGKPDEDFNSDNRHFIRYNNSILGSYLFEFEQNRAIVKAKYFDD